MTGPAFNVLSRKVSMRKKQSTLTLFERHSVPVRPTQDPCHCWLPSPTRQYRPLPCTQSSSTRLSTAAARRLQLIWNAFPFTAHCIIRYAFAGRPRESETVCNTVFVIVALGSLCSDACYSRLSTKVTVCALQHWHFSRDKYLGQHAALCSLIMMPFMLPSA